MKNKKIIFSVISIILIFVVFIGIQNTSANSTGTPTISVSLKSETTQTTEVGDEVSVTYTVTPGDIDVSAFEDTSEKEIVFCIDISESMYKCIEHDAYINGYRADEGYTQCTYGCTEEDMRITLVKNALKEFMETLKDVSNLKIGIVTYSYTGEIATYNGTDLFDVSNEKQYNALLDVINNLDASGATNTGDGLRKATYLLDEGTADSANKTLIFFTDGEPSRYTVDSSGAYNLTITNKATSTSKVKSDKDTSLDYAINVGNIIKSRGYNVISIACALSSSSVAKIESIHSAMGGSEDDIYYANDSSGMSTIFNDVAQQLKDSYALTGVTLNITTTDAFDLVLDDYSSYSVNGNVYSIDIGSIKYRLNEDRTAYVADSFDVTFTIVTNKTGQIILGSENTITYTSVDGQNMKYKLPETSLLVVDKDSPNIEATLQSASNVNGSSGDEITVTYLITPNSFNYDEGNSTENESHTYTISDAVLNFDLGENFQAVTGLTCNYGNNYYLDLQDITYVGSDNGDGTYNYTADSFTVTFTIKVSDNKLGELLFENSSDSSYNNISYTRLNGTTSTTLIETPTVTVNTNITHGIYEGIVNGEAVIDEDEKSFASNTNVTFAAEFKAYEDTTINLELDKKGYLNGDIGVYKLENGTLYKIGTMIMNGENYSYTLSNITEITDIVLIYEYNLGDNISSSEFVNTVEVYETSKNAKATISTTELPNLF